MPMSCHRETFCLSGSLGWDPSQKDKVCVFVFLVQKSNTHIILACFLLMSNYDTAETTASPSKSLHMCYSDVSL